MLFLKGVLDRAGIMNVLFKRDLKHGKRTYGFPYYVGWNPNSLRATITFDRKRIELNFSINPFSFVQRSDNIKGRYKIVLADTENVENHFVIIHDLKEGIVNYLLEKKARGLVLYDPETVKDARKKFQFWYYNPSFPKFVGIALTQEEIDSIKYALKKGKEVFVDIYVDAQFYDPSNFYLLGRIEGERKDAVLYVAHTCHMRGEANDNGSGAISLLYSAIIMQKMIKNSLLNKPPYTVYFLLVPEMWGSALFVENERSILKDVFAGFNFDMVGSDIKKSGGRVLIEKPHGVFRSNIHSFFKKHVENVQSFVGFPYMVSLRNFEGASDHLIFQDPDFTVPMVMLIHWPDKFYHSDKDVISNIDIRAIWRNVILMVSIPYLIRKKKILLKKRFHGSYSEYEVLRKGVFIPTMDEDSMIRIKWLRLLLNKNGYVNFMHFFYYLSEGIEFSKILSLIAQDSGKNVDSAIYKEYVDYLLEKRIIRKVK